jgi:hypothetical protein
MLSIQGSPRNAIFVILHCSVFLPLPQRLNNYIWISKGVLLFLLLHVLLICFARAVNGFCSWMFLCRTYRFFYTLWVFLWYVVICYRTVFDRNFLVVVRYLLVFIFFVTIFIQKFCSRAVMLRIF